MLVDYDQISTISVSLIHNYSNVQLTHTQSKLLAQVSLATILQRLLQVWECWCISFWGDREFVIEEVYYPCFASCHGPILLLWLVVG